MTRPGWHVRFEIRRPLPHFPRPCGAAVHAESSPAYRCEGRLRQLEGDRCAFVYTLAGEGIFEDRAGAHRLVAETGFLCRIADPETAYYYPPGATDRWRMLWITFEDGGAERQVADLVARHGPLYRLPPDRDPIAMLLDFEAYAATDIAEISPYAGQLVVARLLAGLGESASRLEGESSREALVARFQNLLRSDVEARPAVKTLAARLRVSREHLSRTVRAALGMSVQEYVHRQCMFRAARLLQETTLSVKEIAVRFGYGAPTNFSRAFRRVLGVTPRQYRALAGPARP